MSRRPRRNDSPAFKAKVALEATRTASPTRASGTRSMCDLPVPVARPGDRAREPGLGDGPELHPDVARLRVSGRDH